MQRTIFLALVAALLLVVPAAHAADPTKIIRDCADDSILQGKYTASELRNARNNLPTDIDEYSDCRDVLARAISAATRTSTTAPAATQDSGGGAGGGAGGSAGGNRGSGGSSGNAPPTSDSPFTPEEEAALAAPSSPADAEAVASAAQHGDRAVRVEASPRSPGAARLAADVGRNGLPTSMIGVLVLLGATLLAGCLPLLRRGPRGVADPSP